MESNHRSLAAGLHRLACGLALAASALGGAVLASSALSIPAEVVDLLPATHPLCEVALVALGLSAALVAPARARRFLTGLSRLLAAAVVAVGAVALLDQATGRRAGLDAYLPPALGGGLSVGTGAALLLAGVAVLLVDVETRRGNRPSQLVALFTLLVPLQALIGYFYGVRAEHGVSPITGISPLAAAGVALVCGAVLLARPEHGLVRVMASPGAAGFTARRLLPASALLPVVLGWVFLVAGLRAGQYEAMAGASLLVLSAVVTGGVVVWWNAREIERMEEGRSLVEEALRAEREWFRTTLGSIGDAVMAADHLGRVSDMNAVAETLTGFRAEDALGRPLEAIFQVLSAAEGGESPFARVFTEGRVTDLPRDTALVAHGGAGFPVEGCAAPIRDRRGRVRGVVIVFRDIRERRRVEEERTTLLARERAARAEAEQASRAKDEFIATLSHELRTPLNSVLGWARLLRSGKLDAKGVVRAVDAIERGATTQAQIVDDLLDMARIVRGQLRLDVRPVELVPVIEAALDTVRPAAAAREIEIVPTLDAHAGPVAGDPGRLQQVVWNLLTNAIKFTPPRGRVEVHLDHRDDHVEIAVRDSGAGIAPDFVPHVFERFRQADSSTTRAHGGLGLGLAIVRHLVEAHGGTVAAESAGTGQGSTFTVSLPVFLARQRAPQPEAPRPTPRAVPSLPAPVSLAGVRVLIVDDDADTLEVVRQLLEHAGAGVETAASGPAALEALQRAPPDVLLSDIGMPGQDGYELIRQVRRLAPEQGGLVPAAALTAFAQSDHHQRALAAGYQLYLAKPVEPAELTAAVARLASGAAA